MVKKMMLALFLLGFVCAGGPLLHGTEDLLAYILENNPPGGPAQKSLTLFSPRDVSEMKIAALGLVRFYQLIITSQDRASCNFTFSCSNFSRAAIRNYGIIHGLLMTSDRLQRCNSMGRKDYPVDAQTGRAVDYPLERYHLGPAKK